MVGGPAFGCAQNSMSYGIDVRGDFLELTNGFTKHRFYRKKDTSVNEVVEILSSYGIRGLNPANNPLETPVPFNPFGRVLTEVSESAEEEVITHEAWNQNNPNTSIDLQGGALVGVDALLVLRVIYRWSVSGKGRLPYRTGVTPWAVGDDVTTPLQIGPATGGATPPSESIITIPAGAQVENISEDASNTEFKNWRIEFALYVGQTADNATSHILPTPSFVNSAFLPTLDSNDLFKISITKTLSAEDFARRTVSVDIYEPVTV